MASRTGRRIGTAALLLAVAGIAGCGGEAAPGASSAAPSASATVSPSTASPSPTLDLTPEEQAAFDEATAVALAYRQTIADLYSGARTDLNDLDKVATGELLDRGLRNIQQGLSEGYRSEPMGVTLTLVSAEPVSVDLDADPPEVVVRACIDATALTAIDPDGTRTVGMREELVYGVVRVPTSAGEGWAVASTEGAADAEARRC